MSERKPRKGENAETAVEILDAWLAEARLIGADAVRAAAARRLARALDTAPDYSLARIAGTLGALVDAIEHEDLELADRVVRSLRWLQESA